MENKSKKSKINVYKEKEWLLSAGSGDDQNQNDPEESDSSFSSTSNVKIAFFDPPIERFAFVQKFSSKKDDDNTSTSNLTRSIAGSQLFM